MELRPPTYSASVGERSVHTVYQPYVADGRREVAAIAGRPAIEIVPEITHGVFAVDRTSFRNVTLDSSEIWYDYLPK